MSLEIKQICYRLKSKALIEKISVNFESGRLYGILGPNGSGKTTLLKLLAGIWTPTNGEILWKKKNLVQLSGLEKSRITSFVPQTPSSLFDFTVYDMVAMGCYSNFYTSKEELIASDKALKAVDAWHLKDRLISQISGGERQRVYIARALANESPILLLDEPFAHLDVRHQLEIWYLLKELSSQGKLVITSVHDLTTSQRFCDEVCILNKGCCVIKGDYSTVMNESRVQEIFGIKFGACGIPYL